MNRRDVLLNSGAMVISASLGAIACATQKAVAQPAASPPAPADPGLVDAALDCQKHGGACADHCVRMLSSGDTSMAACVVAVRDMLSVSEALAKLASTSSKHLPGAARLAMEACGACEAECRKHASVHPVCRECADACARTVAACRKVAG